MTVKPITNTGKQILNKKLQYLKNEREKIVKEITKAKEKGDLSENYEYHAAKAKNSQLIDKIDHLERYLQSTIVPKIPSNISMVCFGTWVTLKDSDNQIHEYGIVGNEEACTEKLSISISSEFAIKLLGKKVGEKTEIKGKIYEIVSIAIMSDKKISEVILDDEWS